jgi:TRAP-type mannitol/chloroaromatic compound transport system permease large subunit
LVALNIDLIWIGILLAINLQTSFLTPPFGFSLFYLKSVAPKEIKTKDIYYGVIPFVFIQLLFLIFLFFNPDFIYIIPNFLKS